MSSQGAGASQAPGIRYSAWIFGTVLSGFFLIGLWAVAANVDGQMSDTQLVWSMGWLLITSVTVFAVFWRLTTPPSLPQMPPPPPPPTPAGQQPGANWGEAQVLATMISGQDHITWLAFTLGMTSEVLLLVGFFQDTLIERYRWVVALGGVLVALVFRNMVIRSNGDMCVYMRRASANYGPTMSVRNGSRRGIPARWIMDMTFWAWVIAWLIALGVIFAGEF